MAEAAGRLRTVPDGRPDNPDNDGKDGGGPAGRILDVAAAAAGVFLVLIAADMLSGGRLSRWLLRRGCRGCQEPDPEGGGDDS